MLAMMVAETLPAKDEVWVAIGSGNTLQYMAAHQIEAHLGSEKSCALPLFHALTGCDTMSVFARHGNKIWMDYNIIEFIPGTY